MGKPGRKPAHPGSLSHLAKAFEREASRLERESKSLLKRAKAYREVVSILYGESRNGG